MESRAFLFTIFPIIGIIVIFGYLNLQQEPLLAQEDVTKCQSIENNGEDRIDILFISSKEDAEHYTEFFLNIEPYKSKRNYFNTYVIEESNPKCEYYKGIAILCNTKEVQSLAKSCPHDYIVVIKEDERKIRSSAYGNVISINKVHEDSVLIHELGHALGNLAEEYGGAKIPQGSKNCVSSCEKFEGAVDSCDLECSESSYYRQIYAGVMRTLSTSNYGIYNKNLIDNLLEKNKPDEVQITGKQIQETQSCKYPVLRIELQGEDVKTDNILENGCVPDKGLTGPLCIDEVCNINTLFTDSQEVKQDETLRGETYESADSPLIFYLEKDPLRPLVDITLNDKLLTQINTAEAGATACTV